MRREIYMEYIYRKEFTYYLLLPRYVRKYVKLNKFAVGLPMDLVNNYMYNQQ